ncbi:MAG: hypothetical protein U1C73_02985 [Dietzia sp.]|nr:hypothetical protein [Dietzia sp.]
MRYDDAPTTTRLHCAIALAIVCWVLAVTAESGVMSSDTPAPHSAHAVASAPGAEFAVIAEHPHVYDGSALASPETVAAAVPPRGTTMLVALAVIAAICVLAGCRARDLLAAVRGPPGAAAVILTGQQILTRFCIARR